MNMRSIKERTLNTLPLVFLTLFCLLVLMAMHEISKNKIEENKQRTGVTILQDEPK